MWQTSGDDRKALSHAIRAQHLFGSLDMPAWEAWALNQVGWHQAQLGEQDQARVNCEAALALARRTRDREGEATTLDSLGYIAHSTGHHDEAVGHYQQALRLLRDLGNVYHEADTLERIGQTYHDLHRHDLARTAWQQALELYRAQHRVADASRVTQQLVAGPPPAPLIKEIWHISSTELSERSP